MIFEVFGRLGCDVSVGELRGTGDYEVDAGGDFGISHYGFDRREDKG